MRSHDAVAKQAMMTRDTAKLMPGFIGPGHAAMTTCCTGQA
jgi:hypothetical protein